MKKVFFIFLLLFLPVFIFAKDDVESYWEKETDLEGQLFTYYLVKTDEQLSYNLDLFIKSLTGIKYDFYMPNTSILIRQMVSEEYLKKNCPKVYQRFMENEENSNDNKIEWEKYKYCFTGQAFSDEWGVVCLLKRTDEKKYLSMAMYSDGGANWLYTNQILALFEESVNTN